MYRSLEGFLEQPGQHRSPDVAIGYTVVLANVVPNFSHQVLKSPDYHHIFDTSTMCI